MRNVLRRDIGFPQSPAAQSSQIIFALQELQKNLWDYFIDRTDLSDYL